jgi:nitrile hydratase
VSFSVGQRVRVSARAHDGHHRTPGYLKGCVGEVAQAHGAFTNPETRAYGADGLPEQPLYLVAFSRSDLFPEGSGDRVYADLFEHWLEDAG